MSGPSSATRLPTINGVRGGLVKAAIDKDGRDVLYVADGWQADCGRKARARLTQVKMDKKGTFFASLIEEVGEAAIPNVQHISIADIDGDGRQEIIATVPWSKVKAPNGLRYHAHKLGKDGWVAAAPPVSADLSATDWQRASWTAPRKAGAATPSKPR